MKPVNLMIVAFLAIFTVLGWFMFLTEGEDSVPVYQGYINQGDEYMKEGLYQRAILEYEKAAEGKQVEDIYIKMMAAYESRYCEDSGIEEDYMDALQTAISLYPRNKEFVTRLADFYILNRDYAYAYNCLYNAQENGLTDKEIAEYLKDVRYSFEITGSPFRQYLSSTDVAYTVCDKEGRWGIYSTEEGTVFGRAYSYAGPMGTEGIAVLTGQKDSRLLRSDGFVLGIFDEKVEAAGVYAEGRVPVCIRGRYAYYDEFADKLFGDYDTAGTFVGGKAAVAQNGIWILIDTNGKVVSESFDEIVLNDAGQYICGGVMVACKSGKYSLYDAQGKQIGNFSCDEMDACEGGLIAYRKGNQWGYISTDGKVVIQPQYENARSFSCGLAAVCVDGLWGFIDINNECVIECQFTDAGNFDRMGTCMVRTDKSLPDEYTITDSDEAEDAEVTDEFGGESTADDTEKNENEMWQFLELRLGIIAQ